MWGNGQVRALSHYKDGKLDGLETAWHENGKKGLEAHHKNGKEDGLWTVWHENGKKRSEGRYKNGKAVGPWTEWDENEKLVKTELFKHGELGNQETAWEERGVSLQLKTAPSVEHRAETTVAYNALLDEGNFLRTIVQDLGLVAFYGAPSEEAAIELLKERSKVLFKDERTIWILHRAQRHERDFNDRLGRALGDAFVAAAFPGPPEK